MQTPIDAVLDGFGFDEAGRWHNGELMDHWRWGFSELNDTEMKTMVADAIMKMLLRAETECITADEMMVLRMTGLGSLRGGAESGYRYDA